MSLQHACTRGSKQIFLHVLQHAWHVSVANTHSQLLQTHHTRRMGPYVHRHAFYFRLVTPCMSRVFHKLINILGVNSGPHSMHPPGVFFSLFAFYYFNAIFLLLLLGLDVWYLDWITWVRDGLKTPQGPTSRAGASPLQDSSGSRVSVAAFGRWPESG